MSVNKTKFEHYTSELSAQLFMHPITPMSQETAYAISWHLLNSASILNVALEMIDDPSKKLAVTQLMDSICEKPLPKSPVTTQPNPIKT